MAVLKFQDLSFEKEDSKVRVNFLKLFYFNLEDNELSSIAPFIVKEHEIEFKGVSEAKAQNKFNLLLLRGFEHLRNKLTGKKAVYIHKFSGIPLIGSNAFGIIDRNTSIIEVRPITGCNLECIYCSVNQNSRSVDFVVEKDYLVQEFKKIVEYKGIQDIEAHIGTQGEPLFYEPLVELVSGLKEIPNVSVISIDTNATLLTEKKVDRLIEAGMTQFNVSINSLDEELAKKMACSTYNLTHILKIIEYIAKKDCRLIIAPVWIKGVNDAEMPKLIQLAKKLNCTIGIQNFLEYKQGKNPGKQMSWDEFKTNLKKWETEFDMHLLFDFKKDFNVRSTKPLPMPFKNGETIKAKVMCPGRMKNEYIAVAKDRCITISGKNISSNTFVKAKITRTKHNIFYAM